MAQAKGNIGAPGVESFRNAITSFPNGHIIAALTPMFDLRSEIVGNEDFKVRGGFNTVTRDHFVGLLLQCDRIRRDITYNRTAQTAGDLIALAIEHDVKLQTTDAGGTITKSPTETDHELKKTAKPFGGDQVQRGRKSPFTLPWAIDGSDDNIPMLSKFDFRNRNALLLLSSIDGTIVEYTRLESRFKSRYITQWDSLRMYSAFVEIFEYLMMFSGDENVSDFAQGVLPAEEPRGPDQAPNLRSETSGAGQIFPNSDNAGKVGI